jgi:spore coat protein SA
MKKICFILPPLLPFPPSKGGAVETLLSLFIDENEKKKKYNITVFSVYDAQAELLSRAYKYTDVVYIRPVDISKTKYTACNIIQKITGIRISQLDDYNYKILEYLKEKYNPDLCIVEGGRYREYSNVSKFIGSDRMAIHIHAVSTPKFNANNIYQSFIFVSECAKNFWQKNGPYNSYVLPNAADESRFNTIIDMNRQLELRNSLGLVENDFVILYCGRLIEEKGVLELLKAVNRIDNNSVKLMIVGSSNFAGATVTGYQKELESKINDRVIFTGFIDNKELPIYYQMVDLVVSPSICQEAASLVNIEAMMAGKALITTSQGGNPEYVNSTGSNMIDYDGDKNHLIDQLYEKILYMINNRELVSQMSENNKKYAERFKKQNYFENYSKIIDSVINSEEKE